MFDLYPDVGFHEAGSPSPSPIPRRLDRAADADFGRGGGLRKTPRLLSKVQSNKEDFVPPAGLNAGSSSPSAALREEVFLPVLFFRPPSSVERNILDLSKPSRIRVK